MGGRRPRSRADPSCNRGARLVTVSVGRVPARALLPKLSEKFWCCCELSSKRGRVWTISIWAPLVGMTPRPNGNGSLALDGRSQQAPKEMIRREGPGCGCISKTPTRMPMRVTRPWEALRVRLAGEAPQALRIGMRRAAGSPGVAARGPAVRPRANRAAARQKARDSIAAPRAPVSWSRHWGCLRMTAWPIVEALVMPQCR